MGAPSLLENLSGKKRLGMYTPPTTSNAIAFASRGHAVLPLHGIVDGKCTCGTDCGRNAGKHPHHFAPHGLKNATTDLDKIRHWFRKHPELNYGVRTDTLPTIDIDPRNGGDKSWGDLVRKNYDIVGWRVRTGGGGEHIMLGTASTELPSAKLAKGIEFQSTGKYIVGAGSMHVSGKRYMWDKSAAPKPGETSPQAPPVWLQNMLRPVKPKNIRTSEEAEEFYTMLVSPAEVGDRRSRLAMLAGHVFGTPYPNRGVLACLMVNHMLQVTPDLTDFGKEEMFELLADLVRRDDIKRGLA